MMFQIGDRVILTKTQADYPKFLYNTSGIIYSIESNDTYLVDWECQEHSLHTGKGQLITKTGWFCSQHDLQLYHQGLPTITQNKIILKIKTLDSAFKQNQLKKGNKVHDKTLCL